MGYELSHDSLAKQIYQKASTEAQTRRKIEHFVHQKYQAWLDRKARLTRNDLGYIAPHLTTINISEAEKAFLKKEKYALTRGRLSRFATFLLLIVAIGFAALLFTLKQQAEKATRDANIQKQIALTQQGIAMTRKAYAENDITFATELAKHQYGKEKVKITELYHLLLQSVYHTTPLRLFYKNITKTEGESLIKGIKDPKENQSKKLFSALIKSKRPVQKVQYLQESSNYLSLDEDNIVRLWNSDNDLLAILSAHKAISDFAIIDNGNALITTLVDGTFKKWDINSAFINRLAIKTYKYDSIINTVQFSPTEESILTACSDGMARIQFFNSKKNTVYFPHKGAVNTADFSSDGENIVTASEDQMVGVWNINSEVLSTSGEIIHPKAVSKAFFLNPNKVLSISHTTGMVWRTDHTMLGFDNYYGIGEGSQHYYEITDAAVSPTGDTLLLVTPWADGARLWDFKNLDFKSPLPIPQLASGQGPGGKCAYSDDGQKLLLTKGKTFELFSNTGEKILSRVSDEVITAIAFSKDVQYILVGFDDGGVKLYTIRGEEIFHFHPHQQGIKSVAFAPNNIYFATSSLDANLHIWPLKDSLVLSKVPDNQVETMFNNKEKVTLLNYTANQFNSLKDSLELLNIAHLYLDQHKESEAVAIYKQMDALWPNSNLLSPEEKIGHLKYDLATFLKTNNPKILKDAALYYEKRQKTTATKKLLEKAWGMPGGQQIVSPQEAIQYLGVDSSFFLETDNAEIALGYARYYRAASEQKVISLDFVKSLYHRAEELKGNKNWNRISIQERKEFLDYKIPDFLTIDDPKELLLVFKYYRTLSLRDYEKELVCELYGKSKFIIEKNKDEKSKREYVFPPDVDWVNNNCSFSAKQATLVKTN